MDAVDIGEILLYLKFCDPYNWTNRSVRGAFVGSVSIDFVVVVFVTLRSFMFVLVLFLIYM